jgi:hypothetical protein
MEALVKTEFHATAFAIAALSPKPDIVKHQHENQLLQKEAANRDRPISIE